MDLPMTSMTRYLRPFLAFQLLLLVLSAGCSGNGREGSGTAHIAFPVPLDSVGVEIGDADYVFGVIASVEFLPDGRLLVLDSNTQTLRVFSADGGFLARFGGTGEAPGELLSARDLAVIEGNVVVVTDPRAAEFEFFHADTGYIRTVQGFMPRAPFTIDGAGLTIVGHQGLFDRDQGLTGNALSAWTPESSQPVLVFMEEWSRFDPSQMTSRFFDPDPPLEVTDSAVYYSPLGWESYEILVFDMQGNRLPSITRPGYAPLRKTAAELSEEAALYEQRRQQMLAMGRGGPAMANTDYTPSEYHFAVTSLGMDASGRLWARRGGEPVFDLFDGSSGEWLGTAQCPPGMESWAYVVTPYGVAAFDEDPADYPRVVILEY